MGTHQRKNFEKNQNLPKLQQSLHKLFKMQKKTIFLVFAIGHLVFVNAFPTDDDFQQVGRKKKADIPALKKEWERNPENYRITPKGLEITLNKVEGDKLRAAGTTLQRWSDNFYKNHVKEDDFLKDSLRERNVERNTLFTLDNLIALYVNRQRVNGGPLQGGPVRLNAETEVRTIGKFGVKKWERRYVVADYTVKNDYINERDGGTSK